MAPPSIVIVWWIHDVTTGKNDVTISKNDVILVYRDVTMGFTMVYLIMRAGFRASDVGRHDCALLLRGDQKNFFFHWRQFSRLDHTVVGAVPERRVPCCILGG